MTTTQERDLAEYASLREEMLRSNDQALSLQGFTLASVALVVGAAVAADISPEVRLVLFSALQIVVLLIVIQVGARRRQHATIASYLTVFHETAVDGWENRIQARRRTEGPLSVDRWYGWGEALFTVFIASVGLTGAVWSFLSAADLEWWWTATASMVNLVGITATAWQTLRKRMIQDLMEREIGGWQSLLVMSIEPETGAI